MDPRLRGDDDKNMTQHKLFRLLLAVGAAFYVFEAIIHWFGLPILEHDKIWLATHDRYIAIFALTYAVLLVLIATDVKKYKELFVVVMVGILVSMLNAALIARGGGYASFGTGNLDTELTTIGIGAVVWVIATTACAIPLFRKK